MTKFLKLFTDTKDTTMHDIMVLLFRDKTTAESINLMAEVKIAFEEELSKRKTNAIQENNAIIGYFKNTPKLSYTTVKDEVFNKPIQN